MQQRQKQYFEFRRMIALRAKYYFIVMLSNRHYVGKINFNHQAETLSIDVSDAYSMHLLNVLRCDMGCGQIILYTAAIYI